MKRQTMARCLAAAAAWVGWFGGTAWAADATVADVAAKQRYP